MNCKKMVGKILICFFMFSLLSGERIFADEKIRDKSDVNSFDRLVMNSYSKNLDMVGTGLQFATLLTPAVLLGAPKEDYWKIGIQYVETIGLAYGVNKLAKLCVSRDRPYMYFSGAPEDKIEDGDFEKSFFSGHSTRSFAAASFTSCMFCRYFPDSDWKLPVIISSYTLATTTAVMRLASGNHFMSDVITGAVVGGGIGILVPWINSKFWKPSEKNDTQVAVTPMGFHVQMKF